jgi:hypothetical protein
MLRWTFSILLLLLSTLAIFANGQAVVQRFKGQQTGSFALIIGGVLGAIGLLISPMPSLHKWFWVPAVLDFGCLPYFAISAWFSMKSK